MDIDVCGRAYELYQNSDLTLPEISRALHVDSPALLSKLKSLEAHGYNKTEYREAFDVPKPSKRTLQLTEHRGSNLHSVVF